MANPPNQIGDRSKFFISSSSAEDLLLRKVKSVSETDNQDGDHVHNTHDSRPAGVVRKPGGGALELEVYEERGTPEVDWTALQVSREFFTFTREVVGGRRIQYLDCTVVNVAAKNDDQGSHMMTVKLLWGDRLPL